MTGELEGRVAVITGGSGGIGSAILCALADAGATAISLDLVAPASPPATPFLPCDVREDASVGDAVRAVVQQHGRLDLAIYAAGVSREAVTWKLAVDDWDLIHAVNLRGAFLVLRHVIPAMRQAGGGRVVLIGSINGSRGKIGTAAYSASKAGLLGLAKTAARETGRFGICVNVVEPGWVRTPLTETLPEDVREAARRETLLGTLTEPADVASAVRFLCGPGAARITGQILRVDAGQLLGNG
jgi:3-oxoacyl-[acyl-carrier protein] reductase